MLRCRQPRADPSTVGSGISTYSLVHDNAFYVNVEKLEVHRLIHDNPLCSKLDSNNLTTLYIEFADYSSFQYAKQQWADREDLLFVAEDPSCEAEAGERSVYEALSYEFAEGPGVPITVHITAAFHGLSWHSPGAASKIKLSFGGLDAFNERTNDAYTLVVHKERGIGDDLTDGTVG
jgi:hypothetical protein